MSGNLEDFAKVQTNKGFDALWAPEPKLQVLIPHTPHALQRAQRTPPPSLAPSALPSPPVSCTVGLALTRAAHQAAHLSPSGYVLAEPYYAAYVRAMSQQFASGAPPCMRLTLNPKPYLNL